MVFEDNEIRIIYQILFSLIQETDQQNVSEFYNFLHKMAEV